MNDKSTPETDALVPQFLAGSEIPDLFAFCRKLEIERNEARRQRDETNHSSKYSCEYNYEKMLQAYKIAEKAIDDLGWFNETNAQRLRLELNQLKEGAK